MLAETTVCVTIPWLPYHCRIRRSPVFFRILFSSFFFIHIVSYCRTSQFRVNLCRRTEESERKKGERKSKNTRKEKRIRKWIEKIGDGVYRTACDGMDVWCKSIKTSQHVFVGSGNAIDGTRTTERGQRTETDRLASLAGNNPAYLVRVSLNELANCSQRCTRSALRVALTPTI